MYKTYDHFFNYSDYGYVETDGENTGEEKKLFALVYGTENPGKGKKVYLFRPDIVEAQLKGQEDELIARACYFDDGQDFGAVVRDVGNYVGAVRGVRLGHVAEGDGQNNAALDDIIHVQLPRGVYTAMKAGQPFAFEGKEYEMKLKE